MGFYVIFQPAALSQGMTPLSPASPLVGGLTINSLGLTLAHLMFDPLPFNETENTTSSKLEHLLSVVSYTSIIDSPSELIDF